MVAVLFPLLHVYMLAPLAVMVVEYPEQMVVLVPIQVTVGDGFTKTVCMAVLEQPVTAEVPVTE